MARSSLLPVTYLQEYLCSFLTGPEGTDAGWRSLTLAWAWQVSPSVDLRRLERAFQALQTRHDVFRLGFVPTRAGWRARLHEKPRARLGVVDCGPMDEAGRKQAIEDRIAPRLHLGNDALLALDVLRFGSEGDVIVLQINHMLTDGFGAIMAVEDLMSLFLGLPVPGGQMGFAEYMATCFQRDDAQIAAGWEYWRKLLLPPPPPVKFGLLAKGIEPNELPPGARHHALHRMTLNAVEAARIAARSRALGCTPFALAAAAFYGAVRDASGAEELNFATVLGRNDARLDRFAGCHIDLLEMVCRRAGGRTVSAQAQALHRQIRTSIGHLPHPASMPDSDLVSEIVAQGGHARRFQVRMAHSESREARSRLAGILAPKAGVLQLGKYQAREVPIKSPATIRELVVEQSAVPDGLRLDILYDQAGYDAAEIEDFTARLAELMQGAE